MKQFSKKEVEYIPQKKKSISCKGGLNIWKKE